MLQCGSPGKTKHYKTTRASCVSGMRPTNADLEFGTAFDSDQQTLRSLATVSPAGKYSDPVTHISTLSNGLTVATESHPHAQTATVGVWVDAGSRVDGRKASGSAHFLEVSCHVGGDLL
jgi:hypothetical protein